MPAEPGDFLADAFALAQESFAEMFLVVDDHEEDIFRAEDADGLLIGEEGEAARFADFEFLGVAGDALEKLGREHADGFGIEVRRQLTGEEKTVGSRQHAALESGKFAGEADDFLESEFAVFGDAEEFVQ